MMLELLQCEDDPIYFITTFMKIQHPTKGSVPFVMYPYQYEMVDAFHNNRFCCALTGRQMGKTTVAAAYLLWRAMFNPDTTILIAANTYNQALEIMERVRYGYAKMSDQRPK